MTTWANRLAGCCMRRISTSRHIRMWTKLEQINAEEVHELVKQALKIEMQEIDEDHDGYKTKEKVARVFISRIDREKREGY
jgi:hypothetical protein